MCYFSKWLNHSSYKLYKPPKVFATINHIDFQFYRTRKCMLSGNRMQFIGVKQPDMFLLYKSLLFEIVNNIYKHINFSHPFNQKPFSTLFTCFSQVQQNVYIHKFIYNVCGFQFKLYCCIGFIGLQILLCDYVAVPIDV